AVSEILSRQLFGTDIDERVVAMARFSLMMKAVRFDPDLTEDVVCENVITIRESGHDVKRLISLLGEKQGDLSAALQELADIYENAAEYGSITVLDSLDTAVLPLLRQAVSEGAASGTPGSHRALEMIRQTEILSRRYDVVVTNPPYLSRYGEKLKEYVSRHYPSFKKDLFGVFIRRCSRMMKENGYLGMMTPMVWMFIRSYEPLRRFIVSELSVQTLTQMEYSAFDDATVPICAFVLRGSSDKNEGTYFRLADFTGGLQVQKEKLLAAVADISCPYRYVTNKKVFSLLPGTCFAYWISPGMLSVFEKGTPLGGMAFPKQGLATTDNGKYLRLWHEVDFCSIAFGMKDTRQAASSGRKWFPYNKGGDFRKWYGNNDYVVDYENDGESIKASVMEKYPYLKNYGYVVKNTEFYFRPCASWSLISSSDTAFRFKPEGFIFDVAGMSLFSDEHLYFLLALCNSSVAREILRIIAPTINFQCGDIARIPVIMPDKETEERITALAEENMELCREDWDSFETS
ncbi:MAG: Eco57I restriction-modification methylase domain-containing protein, partial [Lachnospiraceae bacterium]|nr:Eco57I restriction-modification methylase domain-containing protein [Lachnospiraceae bacterium]